MKSPAAAGLVAGIVAVSLVTLSACGSHQQAAAPPAPTSTNTDSGDVDPRDPKAGLNTQRPDSVTDVKPEAGGQKTQ
jgi:hypothetical protein